MLSFAKLTLEDIERIKPYFSYSTNKTCDNTVGGTFMWRDYFSVEYAEFNETLIFKVKLKYYNNITAFSLPLGKDIHGSIRAIEEYCNYSNMPVVFCTVTEEEVLIIKTIYTDLELRQEKNWSDYVYNADDLVSLAGRKYSGQRNHINYFKKTFENYSFEEITTDNVGEVKEFYNYLNSIIFKDSDIFLEEQKKTLEVLDNYERYGMIGGLLRIDSSIAAFSIGEVYNNVLYIHIEKADLKYRGAYQIINNEFAMRYASGEVEFINREEDVGDDGLRTSKLSYHPCGIIDKYIVVVK
jgi:hypothetical protein